MTSRPDVTALLSGVVFLAVAGLALWTALGPGHPGPSAVVVPLGLVAFGLAGLLMSRPHT